MLAILQVFKSRDVEDPDWKSNMALSVNNHHRSDVIKCAEN